MKTGKPRILPNRASGYIRDGEQVENAPLIDMPVLTGGGNLYSTVDDLSTWDQALTAGLLISRASYEAMYTPEKENYAYGWRVCTEGNRRRIAHGGAVFGFDAVILRFPDDKVCVIVLSNCTPATAQQIGMDLAATVLKRSRET